MRKTAKSKMLEWQRDITKQYFCWSYS